MAKLDHLVCKDYLEPMGGLVQREPKATGDLLVFKDYLDPQDLQETKVLLETMASMVNLVTKVPEVLPEMMEMLDSQDCRVHQVPEACREKRVNVDCWAREVPQVLLAHLEKAWDSTWLPCKQCWGRVTPRVRIH